MGSNSSKNATTLDATNIEITPENNIISNIESTPSKDSEFEDPRSPTLHRTPLSSPSPARSWRKIAAQANFDPRSPSLQRTPTHKLVLAKNTEAFDPRSPSIMRTPLSNLTNSEEMGHPELLSSPFVAGRAIAKSVTMEEAPAPTPAVEPVTSEKAEETATEEEEEQQTSFADSAEMKDALRKDGADLTSSLDASMQLYNSTSLSKDFQKAAMQSVEIVQSEESSPKRDPNSRKRRKNHKNRDSYASSPLKKSYSPVMTSDAENSFSLKQLHSNTPPRSPLSTLSSNRMSSPIDKSKLNINLFENLPPTIAL